MSESFLPFISFLIPIGGLALIAFAVAAVIEGKTSHERGSVIRNIYFYLTSVVTLSLVVGSVIFLVNMALVSWVFTNADSNIASKVGPPPSLYLSVSSKPIDQPTALTCSGDCELTDADKESLTQWEQNYLDWKDLSENPGALRGRDAIAALSFLIVALPFFLIHFRTVQKDARSLSSDERGMIRPTYFYFVSLTSLLMVVVAGGILINLGLRTWVFPAVQQAERVRRSSSIAFPVGSMESIGADRVVNCAEKCDLSDDTVALSKEWKDDYQTWQNGTYDSADTTQRDAALAIPFVLLGIPLFWYHWKVTRTESKSQIPPEKT